MNSHNICSRSVTALISPSVPDGFLEDEIIFERCCLHPVIANCLFSKIPVIKHIEAINFETSVQFLRAAKILTLEKERQRRETSFILRGLDRQLKQTQKRRENATSQ